jgi:hypothetical protein
MRDVERAGIEPAYACAGRSTVDYDAGEIGSGCKAAGRYGDKAYCGKHALALAVANENVPTANRP